MSFDSEPTDDVLALVITKHEVDSEDSAGLQRRRSTKPEAYHGLPDSGQLERDPRRPAGVEANCFRPLELPRDCLYGRRSIWGFVRGGAAAIQRGRVADGKAGRSPQRRLSAVQQDGLKLLEPSWTDDFERQWSIGWESIDNERCAFGPPPKSW